MLPCPFSHARRIVALLLAVLCLSAFFSPAHCPAAEPPVSPERATGVLAMLRNGAGSLTALETPFTLEKTVAGTGAAIAVRGNLFARLPGTLRLESVAPVVAGFSLTETGYASWTGAGGPGGAAAERSFDGQSWGRDLSRSILACLFFDDAALRRYWGLEVAGAAPPVIRLVPLKDVARAHIEAVELAFSDDGKQLLSLRITGARNGDAVFHFGGAATVTREAIGGTLFSALYTERTRRLPLLAQIWSADGKGLDCAVFAEIPLVRFGSIAIGAGGVAVTPDFPDSGLERVLERVGEALREGKGARRHKGDGWVVDITPLDGPE
ncbi:exported hypothetical protein [uncultured delta proteobacterium]|uniref:Uncharacterized protein n=1 Tax=uncultured delta proteobacterium TaxID=34034 RepID=A0A212JIA7_9DELT|nr:exported hypothetical protein [uncultured delta proteobacterium]